MGVRGLDEEGWDEDEPDYVDLCEVLERLELHEAVVAADEFFYDGEDNNEAN